MELALVRFLAQSFGVAFTASPRPALTFFAVQAVVAVVARIGWVVVSPGLAWLISVPALIVAFVMAGLEIAARHDEEIDELLRDLKIAHLLGVFGTFSGCLVFAALGLPEDEALGLVDDGAAQDVGLAMSLAAASEHPEAAQYGVVGGAMVVNGGVTYARGHILEFLATFDLDKQWHRIETGGAIGVLTLIIWLPVLALVVVVLMGVALAVIAVAVKAAESWMDQRGRRPCPTCSTEIRKEASLCFQCSAVVEPEVVLGSTMSNRWKRLFAALRRQPA